MKEWGYEAQQAAEKHLDACDEALDSDWNGSLHRAVLRLPDLRNP